MKKYLLIAVMVSGFAVLPLVSPFASASERHHEMMKDVKKEVEKIENGVVIKITSDNPEAVKRIQERAAKHKDGEPCKQEGHGNNHHEKKGHHS